MDNQEETNQPTRTDEAERFTALILETFRFNGALIAAGDALTKEFGLTSATWQILGAIEGEPLTMAQIARDKGLTRQSVRRTVTLLESKGFVLLQENPDHRRAKKVALSLEGAAVLTQVSAVQVGWANAVAQGVGIEELQMTLRTLKALSVKL